MIVNATVTGDNKIVQVFDADKLPQEYYDGILGKITKLTAEMETIARGLAPVKTGALRASIHSDVVKGRDFIRGTVWSAAGAKAVALEYGATGRTATTVKTHSERLDHAWRNILAGTRVTVKEYTRIQNIAPHPFMKPALQSVGPRVTEEIAAVVAEVTAKANAELNG